MKIYFAGSIRGGRDDKELYLEIINILKNYGEVLTEHIGNMKITEMGEVKTSEFIYQRDMDWLKSSDVVVAEVTTPSLGVGYELGMAETLNKKIICLYRPMQQKFLSAMLQGNSAFKIAEYNDIADLKRVFDIYLK
jgi:nucleoside 2-deoxyribosyltransferase